MAVYQNDYEALRQELRMRHDNNMNEIMTLKSNLPFGKTRLRDRKEEHVVKLISFRTKFLLLFMTVGLFAVYLYGGNDLAKGSRMAWLDFKTTVIEPAREYEEIDTICKELGKGYRYVAQTVTAFLEANK